MAKKKNTGRDQNPEQHQGRNVSEGRHDEQSLGRTDDELRNQAKSEERGEDIRSDEGRNRRENVPPKTTMRYDEGVVTKILTRGDFSSWRDVITWLDFNADQDDELNAREAKAAMTDFKRLEQEGAPFSNDPSQLMQTIHQYKGQSGRGHGDRGGGSSDLAGQG